jgi:N-acetylglutamate synthase-like GNAT family acetyltransferase
MTENEQRGTPDVDPGEVKVTVAPTDDLDAVRALGIASGLDESERDEKGFVGAWAARAADGRLVGGIVLERSGGLDVVNWMSVDAAFRGLGIASRLLAELEREARARGVRRLHATARAPRFFVANGFVPLEEGPEREYLLGDCPACPQFGRECTPWAMMKDLV